MSALGGLGDGTGVGPPGLFWAILAVTLACGVLVLIRIGVGKFINAGNPSDQPSHAVSACAVNGHVYQTHTAVWRCATCGALVPIDGEFP